MPWYSWSMKAASKAATTRRALPIADAFSAPPSPRKGFFPWVSATSGFRPRAAAAHALGGIVALVGISWATAAAAQDPVAPVPAPPPLPAGTSPAPFPPGSQAYPPGYGPNVRPYPPPYVYPPVGAPMVAAEGPQELPYSDGRLVEDGYHVEKKYRMGLVAGGAGTFLGLYIVTAAYSGSLVSKGDDAAIPGLVPVVGPIIVAGRFDYSCEFCGLLVLPAIFLVIDSLAQAAGLGMFIGGMASPKLVQVRNKYSTSSAFPTLRLRPDGLSLVF